MNIEPLESRIFCDVEITALPPDPSNLPPELWEQIRPVLDGFKYLAGRYMVGATANVVAAAEG